MELSDIDGVKIVLKRMNKADSGECKDSINSLLY